MYSIIVILSVIVAILLILIVLIQESKGGGLASGFSGSNVLLGVRKTTDFIEKATWTLAATIVILSIASVYATPTVDTNASIVTDMKAATPAAQLPGQGQDKAAPAAATGEAPAQDAASTAAQEQPAN